MQKPLRLRSAISSLCRQASFTWLVLAAIGCSAPQLSDESEVDVGKVSEALFSNGDFESSTANMAPTGWTVTSYTNPAVTSATSSTRANLNLAAGGSAQTIAVYSATGPETQKDPTISSDSSVSLRWPKFGNYAAYVNENAGDNQNVNSLKQQMVLGINDVDPYDGKPHVRFAVAPVLELGDSSHTAVQQPYFFIQVKNVTSNSVLMQEFNYSNDPGVNWKNVTSDSRSYIVKYTDWQLKDIAPTSVQASLGDTIELEVIAAGCSKGGHFGRVYVDGVGATIPGLAVAATAPTSANIDSDITYNLAFKNGGTGPASNVVVTFTTPLNKDSAGLTIASTTFKALNAPGASCSQPTVGTAGDVVCNYSLLDVGATNSLQVTVHIDPTTTATSLVQGNYQIAASNSTALLGAKVTTALTTGKTYTDASVTNSNGVGAVSFGQQVSYTITATNNGPAAISGGTMMDTAPALLTGVTWTCTGTSTPVGTCAAMGTGSIADSTVNLAVGATVTYVLKGTMPASGSATQLKNIATFSLPGTMADSQSADNSVADTDPIGATQALTLTKAGTATGTVVSVPNAISCGPSCSSQASAFLKNSQLILAATPATGKIFTGWSGGGCSGTSNCTITLGADTAVTATFDAPPSCTTDSTCSATRYCDGVSKTCQLRLPLGSSVPNDTIHAGTCASMGTSCASLVCNGITNKCAKSAGVSCTAGSECASNTCTSNLCTTLSNGSPCGVNSDCATATCKSLHCVPAASGCYADSDCMSTQYCKRSTYTCTTKLVPGTAIPSDTLHTGMCSDAAAVCQSGLCNSSSVTCASNNGVSCSGNTGCVSNTCTTNRCVPASNGCYIDSTCSAGNFCDRSSFTCTPKLATGITMPNDGSLHTAACPNDAPNVCQTSLCNPTLKTCADINGSSCAMGNACVSNTCTSSHCVPASSGCYADADCGAGSYCNRSQYSCSGQLPVGTPIPSDGLHTSSCNDAQNVCQTGKCNTIATTCAADDGATCTGAGGCVSNTCTSNHCVPAMSGCWVDADCAANTFCDRSTLTCTPTLNSGTAIPSDGLHDGTCTSKSVCKTGLCNSTTSTCADASAASCSSANQCVSNACSVSMRCVPAAGGCYVDSDCAADSFCNRSSLTCATKLQPGVVIPSDGLHGGTCSDAQAVCRDGLCDTVTKTCAVSDGAACSGNNQCVNNACKSAHCVPTNGGCYIDADCPSTSFCDRTNLVCATKLDPGTGIPSDGLHGGGCADAPPTCKSGQCNSKSNTCASTDGADCSASAQCVNDTCTSAHCVPASNGCWIDGDCAADKYCDRSMLSCTPQLDAGGGIPSDGLHGGTCSDAVPVCISDKCNSTTKTCARDDGESCSAAIECTHNACSASSHCVPTASSCYLDADCASAEYCDRSTYACKQQISDGTGIPSTDGYHAGSCADAAAVCASGKCNATTVSCASDLNSSCSTNAMCTNNSCDPNGKCGIANGSSGCQASNAATLCQSGSCTPSGRCTPSGGCYIDSDCASDEFCQRSSLSCQKKLPDGTAVSNDGLHDGRCTQPNATATCVSGGCNPNSNTCASNNGVDCTDKTECVRDICGSNGKCGYPDGTGPCNQANGKYVCQSGTCSPNGNVCVPPINKSCAADSDCATYAYCDAKSAQCTADLPDGQALPSDGLHDGQCSPQLAQAACLSGSCSVTTQLCAAALNQACSNNSDCADDVCGSNGLCGHESGTGPCTSSNAADVCQSMTCSQDGNCVDTGHCRVDADCMPDRYCDGVSTMCAARLPAGTEVPNDGIHNGTCPGSGLSAVCVSGSCSLDTNACVVANGAACSDDDECASAHCGSNQKCGLDSAQTGCMPGSECQSGICDSSGSCGTGSSCSIDADCAQAMKFCNNGACVPRLPLGAAIPNDTLHAGSCSDQNAQAVCESGMCNATTGTCSGTAGNTCAIPAQCESNVCGTNARCGLPNGSGPCTTNDATEVCQSGACSAITQRCIAANGCGADAECSADTYCSGNTFSCVPTLNTGRRLPNDGLHGGTCTQTNNRTCTSRACNSATNTCALSNSQSCSGPGDCASNFCASDGKCGAPPGSGHCSVGEASVCRSNTCSPSSLVCIPASNGCASSNDCANDNYCDLSSYTCKPRRPSGDPVTTCPSSGVARECASGGCSVDSQTCVSPLNAPCSADNQCQVGVCGTNSQCGVPDGNPCSQNAASKCQSQSCGSDNTCETPQPCSSDADCPSTDYCNGTICRSKLQAGTAVAHDSLHDGKCTETNAKASCESGACNDTTNTCGGQLNTPCADASACVANACGTDNKCGYPVGEGHCKSQDQTQVCRTGLCSVVGVCLPSQTSGCAVDADCNADTFCDVTQYTCVPKRANGEPLPIDSQHDGSCTLQSGARLCRSGSCNVGKKTCAGPNGASCSGAGMCTSDICGQNNLCGIEDGGSCTSNAPQLCQTNRCSSGQGQCIRQNGGCAQDSDCGDDSYCDPAALSCKAKLASGTGLPADSLHSGNCSDALAARVCQSGQCNPSSNTCASSNGTSCDDKNKCASNACGDNGRCGLAVGENGCTSETQAEVCQSGNCAASGACVPAMGCNVDADCPSKSFCNRTEHVCVAQLRTGTTLPKDGLHDGKCSVQLASTVCVSGRCDAVANTCAAPTNTACSNNYQCETDVCADNGKCGQQNGLGPCQDDSECQSGQCQLESGRCVAAENGCTSDDNCVPEQYCNLTQLRCVNDLPDGTLIPSDAASSGKCTSDVARQVCESGVCNPANDTCAKAGGKECSEASECAADLCSDGACGKADGTAGECTQDNAASACQSGVCQSDLSRCVAAKNGCSADSDCGDGEYCDGLTLACVTRLTAGSKLPADEVHEGTCSMEVAAVVCDTGVCNAHTDACANVLGTHCSAPSDCASNACLDNQCVPTSRAPEAFRLTGGRCSVAIVTAGSLAPSLAWLWLGVLGLRRRERRKGRA